jgi:DNA ligase-1
MGDLSDGETTTVRGSGSSVYTLKNSAGVYSCTCPAWMHQSIAIERRTCKHLRGLRGDEAEKTRLGTSELAGKPVRTREESSASAASSDDGPPLLLAHKWETEIDITGWWLSEKLDGVRAYWDGARFLSRLGNRFHPPAWFVEGFPDHPLDGELWGGRKLFQRTVGIVKRQDQSAHWKELLYVVFDAPAHAGEFEERLEHVRSVFTARPAPYARLHEQARCEGHDHLRRELARVEALGGEGLMARRPRSKYEVGRSASLLKVKSFHDAEARVVAHAAGAGKHKGRLGALVVELANGTRFNIGTGFSDAERSAPPPIGSLVTFRYQELTDGGVPRFPSFVGIRIDASAPSHLAPVPSATEPRNTKAGSPARRRFEMEEDGTRYFWEIELDGARHRVRYGTFERRVKTFGSDDESRDALEARVAEKLAKGFVEVEPE